MATPRLPFRSVESQFLARSASIYAHMVERFSEKRDKNGRIIRIGREVPFTKQEFRAWLLDRLGDEGGVKKCLYCETWVSAADLEIDHMTPPSRGGSLGFDNLAVCCKSCNRIKGKMLAASYVAFRAWALLNIDPDCCKDLFHRLEIAVQLAAKQRWNIVKGRKTATAPQATEDDEPF